MDKKEFSNLGSDIRQIVNDSLNNKDYQKMGKEVSQTVSNTLESVFEEVKRTVGTIQLENQHLKQKPVKVVRKYTPVNESKTPVVQQPKPIYFPHVAVGKVYATLLTVFGSIGIGVFGILIIVFGSVGFGPWVVGSMLLGAIVSFMMNERASFIRKRLKRYKRYLEFFYGKDVCSIPELASYCNVTDRYLVKDLWKMINIGMFPQGHITDDRSFVMLTNNSYNRYKKEQLELFTNQQKLISEPGNSEHDNAIEEGNIYINRINMAKANIEDDEVTIKINRMEDVIDKIIGYIKDHPAQLPDVRRFMQYYLPTTLKLLNAYKEFESQPIQGENIKTAKAEIKDALDTINLAFENLFDNLFASATMDISTDISVLETMLAQEGLTEKDFDMTKSEGGKNYE